MGAKRRSMHCCGPFAFLVLAAAAGATKRGDAPVTFANPLGSSMVLQQAPAAAQVWGSGPAGKTLHVVMERTRDRRQQPISAVSIDANGHWLVRLPPVKATRNGPAEAYRLTAKTNDSSAVLEDVIFGEVMVCGGQSNMQFSVGNASNATAEIAAAAAFGASIRVMTVGRVVAEDMEPAGQQKMMPQRELPFVEQQWARASPETIGGPWGSNFSAVCWFFGRDMHKSTGYPIGLVSANWGATTIETWMSPAALTKCADQKGFDRPYKPEPPSAAGCKHLGASCTVGSSNECCGGRCFYYSKPPLWPAGGYCDEKSPSNSNTQLFDNMITPLLSMTIRGVVWYQGESDVGNETPSADDLASKNYACMMPALVDDWRFRWSEASGTAPDFPFGIVQLSAWGTATGSTPATGSSLAVAATRWGQTANYGYAPNPSQPNTFMAVAVDLAAFEGGCCAGRTNCNTFPNLCIHPWWKQEVGRRLSLGMRNVGYNDSAVCHQGPFPATATLSAATGEVTVTFMQQADGGCGNQGIELRGSSGFELKIKGGNWSLAQITCFDEHSLTLKPNELGAGNVSSEVDAVRYLWSSSPGSHPRDDSVLGNVSVYGKGLQAEALPAPPFFMRVAMAA